MVCCLLTGTSNPLRFGGKRGSFDEAHMATGEAFATFTPSVAMILRKAKTPGRNKMDHTE